MSQSSIFPLHSGHVSLTDDLVSILNIIWVDLISICDIKEALPETELCSIKVQMSSHYDPQQPKLKYLVGSD